LLSNDPLFLLLEQVGYYQVPEEESERGGGGTINRRDAKTKTAHVPSFCPFALLANPLRFLFISWAMTTSQAASPVEGATLPAQ
jgi:hypothetical protein